LSKNCAMKVHITLLDATAYCKCCPDKLISPRPLLLERYSLRAKAKPALRTIDVRQRGIWHCEMQEKTGMSPAGIAGSVSTSTHDRGCESATLPQLPAWLNTWSRSWWH